MALQLPQDLQFDFDPKLLLEVKFPQPSGAPVYIKAGQNYPVNQKIPSFGVLFRPLEILRFGPGPYVVIAVDYDAPVGVREVRHFIGGGFWFGGIDADGVLPLVNTTRAVSEWVAPQPPAGEPAHRYTFLLYKESPGFRTQTIITPDTPGLPIGFNLSTFAAATGLGYPLGGTFAFVATPAS
ncbi:hypothetical protein FA95DRAFT_1494305 [Auriscalpium vulgare]|uniref:Uncharacterized protein n=1 Tax=Auriscalpium vulgare TaxID=40419 RepID=A0ACB8RQ90_9AGAM|nr:hypothetical protein FA95DRAFT_1494305 [Auriscalpium vulgare]